MMQCQVNDPLTHLASLSSRYVERFSRPRGSLASTFHQLAAANVAAVAAVAAAAQDDSNAECSSSADDLLEQMQNSLEMTASPGPAANDAFSAAVTSAAAAALANSHAGGADTEHAISHPSNASQLAEVSEWRLSPPPTTASAPAPQTDCHSCEFCLRPVPQSSGPFLLVNHQLWHVECLCCAVCDQNLQWESSCFFKAGFIYCRKHYKLLSCCPKCEQRLCKDDVIFRVGANLSFHKACFSCCMCQRALRHGDQYFLAGESVFCAEHRHLAATGPSKRLFEPGRSATTKSGCSNEAASRKRVRGKRLGKAPTALVQEVPTVAPATVNPTDTTDAASPNSFQPNISLLGHLTQIALDQSLSTGGGGLSYDVPRIETNSEMMDQEKALRPISFRQELHNTSPYAAEERLSATPKPGKLSPDEEGGPDEEPHVEAEVTDSSAGQLSDKADGGKNANVRQKRVRTSFKHQQLRVMKSYFEINHNPDAKDLRQLSQRTGLPKRVLQVWFQNARAKYRRAVSGGQPGDALASSNASNNANFSLIGQSVTRTADTDSISSSLHCADYSSAGPSSQDEIEEGFITLHGIQSPGSNVEQQSNVTSYSATHAGFLGACDEDPFHAVTQAPNAYQ